MTWLDLVDRLSALAGIEPWFYDLRGKRHETALQTKVLVLSALGLDVSSIAGARGGVLLLEEKSWRRPLAPYPVLNAERPVLDLFLPAARADRAWNWELHLESGETAAGSFRPADLPVFGTREIDGHPIEHRRLALAAPVPAGYQRIQIAQDTAAEALLACAPPRCHLPPPLAEDGTRLWGIAAHVYTLRSERNWGIGDFGDLAWLSEAAGRSGASALAVNPFHALFPERAGEVSPYSPSSRLFLNPIYADMAQAAAALGCPEPEADSASLEPLRDGEFVDYARVWMAKRAGFEALFKCFQPAIARGQARDFEQFRAQAGAALSSFAVFSALSEELGGAWAAWPREFRHPGTPDVLRFARERKSCVLYHEFLQWLLDSQLRDAAARAKRAGMEPGLIRDLALGVNPDGADAWAGQDAYATGLRCGAPPDDFHPQGQEWGVLPFDPLRLRENYDPFRMLIGRNMRHAGGLRIDHVIGLQRQFVVPAGGRPAEGCYLRFPLDDLLGILALESRRSACMVIGEDLGTVPEGFRDRMQQADVFGCAVLYFERTREGAFKRPQDYRGNTAASIGTHDLPTLAGYWAGRDIEARRQAGIFSDAEAAAAHAERRGDCTRLADALTESGFGLGEGDGAGSEQPEAPRRAVHTFLASSSAKLFLAQIDDLLGESEQLNLPGTTTAYPNWRRKLSAGLEEPALAAALEELAAICARQGRGRKAPGAG